MSTFFFVACRQEQTAIVAAKPGPGALVEQSAATLTPRYARCLLLRCVRSQATTRALPAALLGVGDISVDRQIEELPIEARFARRNAVQPAGWMVLSQGSQPLKND